MIDFSVLYLSPTQTFVKQPSKQHSSRTFRGAAVFLEIDISLFSMYTRIVVIGFNKHIVLLHKEIKFVILSEAAYRRRSRRIRSLGYIL